MNPQPKGKGKTYVCSNNKCMSLYTAANSLSKYCSSKCRNSVCNRIAQERRRDRSPRSCIFCQSIFSPDYGDMRRKFCSASCLTKHEYKIKPGSTHRRRAKKFGCTYNNVDRMIVFERDGWVCYICGKSTPIEKMGTKDNDAPEQDHVIPLSHGGSHSYDNVRCCCKACNRDKGYLERRKK